MLRGALQSDSEPAEDQALRDARIPKRPGFGWGRRFCGAGVRSAKNIHAKSRIFPMSTQRRAARRGSANAPRIAGAPPARSNPHPCFILCQFCPFPRHFASCGAPFSSLAVLRFRRMRKNAAFEEYFRLIARILRKITSFEEESAHFLFKTCIFMQKPPPTPHFFFKS